MTCLYDSAQFFKPLQQGAFLDSSVLGYINLHDFGTTRVRRPDHSSIEVLLSQQRDLFSTALFQLLGLLRALLLKNGYFLPLGDKFIL